jgi:hypothetical protein
MMDDTELQSLVAQQINDAVDYIDSTIAPDREKATRYYLGEPFGDEEDGRSQFISLDVRDTVRQIMPQLMRVFFGSERAVEYIPVTPEDVEFAEQATDYVNDIVLGQDNEAFLAFYSAFKDALIRKSGVIKGWWEETTEVESRRFTDLDENQLTLLVDDEDVDVVEKEEKTEQTGDPEMPEIKLYDVRINRKSKSGKIRLAAIPPEELIVSREARSLEDAVLVAHRTSKTVSDLVSLGHDYDEVLALAGGDNDDTNLEAQARSPGGVDWGDTVPTDPAMRRVPYIEAYVRVDKDDDGIAELRRVCTAGAGRKVLSDEAWDDQPFALFCPDPEPHEVFGLSAADNVMDIQRVKSRVIRDMLDSLQQSIFPRTAIVEGQVNLDDALNTEIGSVIRVRAPGMLQPFAMPFVGQSAYPILGYLDEVKESRTGVSKASMGLDADALQSTTRAAVQATVSASQGQMELIARIMAETGAKTVFRNILRLLIRNQDRARMVRLRNRWVPIDPRDWNSGMDVSIRVALGRGSDSDRMQFLTAMADKQESLMARFGLDNPLVSLTEYRQTLASMSEIAGFKDASRFFKEIDPNQPAAPPQPPAPDPIMMQMQIEKLKTDSQIQINQAKLQMDGQSKQQDAQLAVQKLQAEIQIKEADMAARLELEKQKLQAELALKEMELQLKSQPQVNTDMEGVLKRLTQAQADHAATLSAVLKHLGIQVNG